MLADMMARVNRDVGIKSDSCMANLYRDGDDSVCAHKDGDWMHPTIATVVLADAQGARHLCFRRDAAERGELSWKLNTGHGDLVVDKGSAEKWKHWVPKSKAVRGRRLSLTFRQMTNVQNELPGMAQEQVSLF